MWETLSLPSRGVSSVRSVQSVADAEPLPVEEHWPFLLPVSLMLPPTISKWLGASYFTPTPVPGMMTLALKTLAKSQEEPKGLKALDLLKNEQQQWLRRLARTVPLRTQMLGACGCRECPDHHSFNSKTYLATSVCFV